MSNPRDWKPNEPEEWERFGDDRRYGRRSDQLAVAIRWMLVAMLVLLALIALTR